MEELILITYLNDFIFCPMSIYFHRLYGKYDKKLYYDKSQLNGLSAHKSIDANKYSSLKSIFQGIDVYSEKFKLFGKIDLYNQKTKTLIERKNKVNKIYEGYIFQLYAQYYALVEMGFEVKTIKIHSMIDNKNYYIKLPNDDLLMKNKFELLIDEINNFDIEKFHQTNCNKCKKCIYNALCDRGLIC